MDNKTKLCGLIGLTTKAGKIVYGTDACLEELRKGKINLIIVAMNASVRTKLTFRQEDKKNHVAIYEILSIDELSRAMGKVNKAVVGIKDIGFSKKMIDIINGGEQIG